MPPLPGNVPLAACRRCHTPQLSVSHFTARLADSNVPLHHVPQLCVTHCTTHLADSNVPLHHVPQLNVSHFTARLADSNVPLHHVPQLSVSHFTARLADSNVPLAACRRCHTPQLCVAHCTARLADSFLISHVISSEGRQPVIEKSIPYTLPRPVAQKCAAGRGNYAVANNTFTIN